MNVLKIVHHQELLPMGPMENNVVVHLHLFTMNHKMYVTALKHKLMKMVHASVQLIHSITQPRDYV